MRWMIVVALAALCGGCATVTRGMNDEVQILSDPAGADVRISTGLHHAVHAEVRPQGRVHRHGLQARLSHHRDGGVDPDRRGGRRGLCWQCPARRGDRHGGRCGERGDVEHYPNPVMMKMVPLRKGEPPRVLKQEPPIPPPAPTAETGPPQS